MLCQKEEDERFILLKKLLSFVLTYGQVSEEGISVGGAVTLSDLIQELRAVPESTAGFHYLPQVIDQLSMVGNKLLRNVSLFRWC